MVISGREDVPVCFLVYSNITVSFFQQVVSSVSSLFWGIDVSFVVGQNTLGCAKEKNMGGLLFSPAQPESQRVWMQASIWRYIGLAFGLHRAMERIFMDFRRPYISCFIFCCYTYTLMHSLLPATKTWTNASLAVGGFNPHEIFIGLSLHNYPCFCFFFFFCFGNCVSASCIRNGIDAYLWGANDYTK